MKSFSLPVVKVSQLQQMLDAMKDQHLRSKTLFGDLNYLVKQPYSKWDNNENPKRHLKGFYYENN